MNAIYEETVAAFTTRVSNTVLATGVSFGYEGSANSAIIDSGLVISYHTSK